MPPSPIPLSPAAVRLAVEHLPAPAAFCGASAAAYRELIAAWGLATHPDPVVADPPPAEPTVEPEPTGDLVEVPAPPLVLVNPPAKDKIHRERMSRKDRPRKLFGKVERGWYASNGYRMIAEECGVGVCAVFDAGLGSKRGVWLSAQEYASVRDGIRQRSEPTGDEAPVAVGIGGAK